jgi:hypothetical protein
VLTALQNIVGDALGAAVVYVAMPDEAPARFPAVVTRWTGTLPGATPFGATSVYGTLVRNGMRRNHNVTVYVVISQRRNLKDEDVASQDMAQTLMDAIDGNATLDGKCAACVLSSVRPDVIVWGDNAFYMLVADVQIMELM